MKIYQTNDTLLRTALKINGFFSAASGLAFTLKSAPLANLIFQQEFSMLGLPPSSLIFALGIGLLAFAIFVLFTAQAKIINRSRSKLITVLDVCWVVSSGVLLTAFANYFSGLGTIITGGIAIIVLIFAIDQLLGLMMIYQGKNNIIVVRRGAKLTLTASTFTRAVPERVWQVMSDQEGYAQVANNISKVEVLDGQGYGMIRKCTDNDGQSWSETCTVWEDGRAFAFRVHTDAADYPYPIGSLTGEWSLLPESGSTQIRMIFRVTAKSGFLNRLLFILMAAPFTKVCDRLLDNWIALMEETESVNHPPASKLSPQTI